MLIHLCLFLFFLASAFGLSLPSGYSLAPLSSQTLSSENFLSSASLDIKTIVSLDTAPVWRSIGRSVAALPALTVLRADQGYFVGLDREVTLAYQPPAGEAPLNIQTGWVLFTPWLSDTLSSLASRATSLSAVFGLYGNQWQAKIYGDSQGAQDFRSLIGSSVQALTELTPGLSYLLAFRPQNAYSIGQKSAQTGPCFLGQTACSFSVVGSSLELKATTSFIFDAYPDAIKLRLSSLNGLKFVQTPMKFRIHDQSQPNTLFASVSTAMNVSFSPIAQDGLRFSLPAGVLFKTRLGIDFSTIGGDKINLGEDIHDGGSGKVELAIQSFMDKADQLSKELSITGFQPFSNHLKGKTCTLSFEFDALAFQPLGGSSRVNSIVVRDFLVR